MTDIMDDKCPFCGVKFKNHKKKKCKDVAFIYYKILETLDSSLRPKELKTN